MQCERYFNDLEYGDRILKMKTSLKNLECWPPRSSVTHTVLELGGVQKWKAWTVPAIEEFEVLSGRLDLQKENNHRDFNNITKENKILQEFSLIEQANTLYIVFQIFTSHLKRGL